MDDRGDGWVGVVCPVCLTRVYAQSGPDANETECPDCFTMVRVPALAEVDATQRATYKPAEPGTYAIATPEDAPPPKPPPPPAEETDFATLTCPQCSEPLSPELRDRAWKTTCAECLEVVPVPSRDEWRKQHRPRKKKRRSVSGPVGYQITDSPVPDAEETQDYVPGSVFDVQAEIRSEPPPPPPKWTFFSNVFNLPLRPDARTRWLYLSFGCSVQGLLVAILLWLWFDVGFPWGMPFFALPLFWVTLWAGSFAGSCCLSILEDTANGNDRISGWNDGSWRDWAGDTLVPVFLAVLTIGSAFLLGKLASLAHAAAFWPVLAAVTLLGFPFVLLSSLQQGSVWSPFSMAVFSTVARRAWAWGVYYVLAGAIAAAYLLPLVIGVAHGPYFLVLIGSGPVLAAVAFIEARLLGRLAWRVLVFDPDVDTPLRKRSKSRGTRKSAARADDSGERAEESALHERRAAQA